MATQKETQNADIRETFIPHAAPAPPEIKIISHSNIFYWWPAWVAGFAVALISYTQGRDVRDRARDHRPRSPSNNPGDFLHRGSRLAHRLHHHQASRNIFCRHRCHSSLLRSFVRVVWMVGVHPAFYPPHLGAREHGLLPLVLGLAACRLAACVLRVRSADHLARPPWPNDRGALGRWPSAQL